MEKHIFFDFNGTIINDIDLCLDLLNQILTKQNKLIIYFVKIKFYILIMNHSTLFLNRKYIKILFIILK